MKSHRVSPPPFADSMPSTPRYRYELDGNVFNEYAVEDTPAALREPDEKVTYTPLFLTEAGERMYTGYRVSDSIRNLTLRGLMHAVEASHSDSELEKESEFPGFDFEPIETEHGPAEFARHEEYDLSVVRGNATRTYVHEFFKFPTVHNKIALVMGKNAIMVSYIDAADHAQFVGDIAATPHVSFSQYVRDMRFTTPPQRVSAKSHRRPPTSQAH